jgi:chromosome segregation ATPase
MEQASAGEQTVSLSVRNVGGISETSVEFSPGVNVLAGRNATNRTSLLRAFMAALGSDDVSIKSDADEGSVELRIGDETYTRRLYREGGTVRLEGDPYLDDPELADLFAFLLATNETRQAVVTDQDLRELIMRPVDTQAIKDEIEALTEEKTSISQRIDELDELEGTLTELRERERDLEAQIDAKREELAEKRSEIEDVDADIEESKEDHEALQEKMNQLGDVRNELGDCRRELDAQQEGLERLREERADLEAAAEELPADPSAEIDDVDAQIDQLRKRRQRVQSEISTLQEIIQFNEDNLDGASTDITEALTDTERDASAVTDRLLDDSETVVCWTCGHEVDRDEIADTIARLKDLRAEKMTHAQELDDEIDDLQETRIRYEEKQRQRTQVQEQLKRTIDRIESREARIEDLEARRESLAGRVETIEAEVESLQTRKDDTILSLYKEASQLEVELTRIQRDHDEVTDRIAEIESELDTREDLEARREAIADELTDLRNRIDRIEADAIESFNEHMDTVLDVLDYTNIARIWLERQEQTEREGRRTVTRTTFTLHIVRESQEGAAYEDVISHLSESEREVTGLVFALAGYLVHDVHEVVPFMLLDSVEAIDADRIARLVDYFEDYPTYLVTALLPNDADALDESYPRIDGI